MRSIACPNCKTKLAGSADLLGVAVRCSACGTTFTAHQANSPYVEGLPPLPSNRRPLLLGGAVVLGLLLMTGMIILFNQSQLPDNDGGPPGSGGSVAATPPPPAMPSRDPKKLLMTTANGLPIEVPDQIVADSVEPDGKRSTALDRIRADREKEALAAAKAKGVSTSDDVTLAYLKWEISDGYRSLKLGYSFGNNQSPLPGIYTLKLKINGSEQAIAVPGGIGAQGVLPLTQEKLPVGESRGPKVQAWIERTTAGIGVKVSNVVSTE